jgi:hypothetical protein
VFQLGPSPLQQTRTCVLGQNCNFNALTGQGLQNQIGLIAVLDTCGLSTGTSVFSHIRYMNTSIGFALNPSVTDFALAGGWYRLCWCADVATVAKSQAYMDGPYTCSIAEDFQVDAGAMLLAGPSPLHQVRTCLAGQSCELAGFTGSALADADRIAVLETCGSDITMSPQLPDSGIYVARNSTEPFLDSGGEYRLCWCAASQWGCQTYVDFKIDFGQLI